MSSPIIKIENVGKRYNIGVAKERYLSLREEFMKLVSPEQRRKRKAAKEFWALKDISFDVEPGMAVGIVGRRLGRVNRRRRCYSRPTT